MDVDTSTAGAPSIALPVRLLLIFFGSLALGLGFLGAVLPLVPATPFLLIAAGCYVRSWPRASRWLENNRFLGPLCAQGGRHLPPRAKAVAIGLTLLSFGATIAFGVEGWAPRVLLTLLGLGVTLMIARVPSSPQDVGS